MTTFPNRSSGDIIIAIAAVIVSNKAFLSEIDGKIGDGDHGVNMAKGFGRSAKRLEVRAVSLSDAMSELSDVLMSEIGGSMGPLYGMMFAEMAETIENLSDIDALAFGKMLRNGVAGVQDIGSAKLGDKTLLDCLIPAAEAFDAAIETGHSFAEAIPKMTEAAENGRDSTIDMVAKVGRASRLGERSKGVQDAGATSCCLILTALGAGVLARLDA
ncbi:MAG: dihydroxyacetone kinase subunit L [Henriciella sp.]|nr:dihydroxyacetone kinase subunit L [Henriciella sp.]